MDLKPALYGLDREEARRLAQDEKEPAYRGEQLLEWLYKRSLRDWENARNFPVRFREALARKYTVHALTLAESQPSPDASSVKYLFRTRDGHFLETVLILSKKRETVCVSTQLGCKMKCLFCASGKGRFVRNLTAGEIVEQVAGIEAAGKRRVTNVVFMGMGEPLDNFDAVIKAIEILQAPWGFGIGSRRITVSTVGLTPKIEEFVKRSQGRVRLSVSLHSSVEKCRAELVPVSQRYPLAGLLKTLNAIDRDLKREITFEYTLIEGVNDNAEEVRGLAKIAKSLGAKVNLIPYNPIRELDFKTPSKSKMENFRDQLEEHGIRVTLRQTEGRDIHAACGQLRLDREARKSPGNSHNCCKSDACK